MTRLLPLIAAFFATSLNAQAPDVGWPQELLGDDGTAIVIYQPQVEVFTDNRLAARAAVSVKTEASGSTPVFGAIWIEAKLDTNRDTRTAIIRDIEVSDVRFADSTEEQREQLARFIEESVEESSLTISVDQLLAGLDAAEAGGAEVDLKHDAPDIVLSTEPAMLVSIDGKPVFQPVEGAPYDRIVNTPFLIVQDGAAHYLYVGGDNWYLGRNLFDEWSVATSVPADIRSLVDASDDDATNSEPLRIIVVTEPTELIVSAGEPSWTPIEGMDLLYMDNTDSNVFLELSTQRYYLLLSGRWYRSNGVEGEIEWAHVPNDQLPEPFSDIPADSVNADVLAQVAGTQQARDAVLDNTIPQTAAIRRDDASFSVEYDGEPDFAPIEEAKVEYAQNTSAAVFRYGNLYYACDDGVWYVANSAKGPWTVATEVPDAIYRIPASNPHHNVTYVKVYDVTPEVVYVGYTPGYYGSYYYRGSVIYGTGWWYNPWYGPWYYPRYPTWGFHVRYNPWYGWGFGVSWGYSPFRFSFYSRPGWWGVGGYRPYPRPYVNSGYRKTAANMNRVTTGRINRPETRPNLYNRPENRQRVASLPATLDTRQARPATNIQNDVLTDRAGAVYRRDADGQWNRRENGQWNRANNLDRPATMPTARPAQPSQPVQPVQRPANMGGRPSTNYGTSMPSTRPGYSTDRHSYPQPATRPQLERDYGARQQGMQRMQNYQRQATPRRR